MQCQDTPAPDHTLLAYISTAWRWIKRWLFNPPLALFLWQPLIVAFCISAALESSFTDAANERKIVFFSSTIAAFWLGMGGSVRSLVATRPNRSLERLEGVSRSAYLAAISLSTLAKGVAQGIILVAFLMFLSRCFGCDVPLDATRATIFPLVTCLVAAEWMGGFVGLSLSGISATESLAVELVPVLAVFALFFSQPLMDFKDEDISHSARFARILPAHYAHLAMWDWESSDANLVGKRNADTAALAKTTLSWLALCTLISLAAQTVYERNWKG